MENETLYLQEGRKTVLELAAHGTHVCAKISEISDGPGMAQHVASLIVSLRLSSAFQHHDQLKGPLLAIFGLTCFRPFSIDGIFRENKSSQSRMALGPIS